MSDVIDCLSEVDTRQVLKDIVSKIERLEEDKKSISDELKSVYEEAKFNGIDIKALRQVVKMRKMNQEDRIILEGILESYKAALGME